MIGRRKRTHGPRAIVMGVFLAGLLCVPGVAIAQALKDVRMPDTPLVLKAQGSFFVGGEKAHQSEVQIGLGPAGHVTVNQMYVRFMVPQSGNGVPVVMVHGATLTGKSYETTPDGRMGWDEHFVRRGHPVYVPDQVGRGRSGFNQARFNDARAGAVKPESLPRWIRFSDEVSWPNFRFGSAPGVPYADTRFPVTAVDELSKQGVPDVSFGGLPVPNPTLKALSDLATQLNGAVLLGHSQSGPFPLFAALLNPAAAKALVLVEPGGCPNLTDDQVRTLAPIPTLAVYGDHRDSWTGIGDTTVHFWQRSFDSCQALIGRLNAAGGKAEMLDPSSRGIRGNSHMIMQDRNHLQIADFILEWLDEHVAGSPVPPQEAPRALSAGLADYLEMPITGRAVGNAPLQLARVNFLVEEPGARRLFISDQTGTLYIVDKNSRRPVPYINFNGSAGASGLFPRFAVDAFFASGLLGFTFDPEYRQNGTFYTIHLENPALTEPPAPKRGVLPGLDASGFVPTRPIVTPSGGRPTTREAVLVEWTDRNVRNATFEGTAREIMRVQMINAIHPMNDLSFNPAARRGDADWRVLYVSVGDGGTGEGNDIRRLNPQRLDHFGGKIIRIVPDVREHVRTSQLSENGRYRIPSDNPFVALPGARKEIWANGMRNPHRLAWDVPGGGEGRGNANLLAFIIGSNMGSPVRYETIAIVRRGANYGYPLREGPETKPVNPMDDRLGADNTLPLRISDTVVLSQRTPIQDVALAYQTGVEGLGIAGGFVYRGNRWPALQGSVVFGDITSGRIFYARMADLIAATDGNPATTAAYTEIRTELMRLVTGKIAARTPAPTPPPAAPSGGRPFRVDMRLATDAAGEIYILTKSDGMVRRVVSIQ